MRPFQVLHGEQTIESMEAGTLTQALTLVRERYMPDAKLGLRWNGVAYDVASGNPRTRDAAPLRAPETNETLEPTSFIVDNMDVKGPGVVGTLRTGRDVMVTSVISSDPRKGGPVFIDSFLTWDQARALHAKLGEVIAREAPRVTRAGDGDDGVSPEALHAAETGRRYRLRRGGEGL